MWCYSTMAYTIGYRPYRCNISSIGCILGPFFSLYAFHFSVPRIFLFIAFPIKSQPNASIVRPLFVYFCYFISFTLHLYASFVVSMQRYSAWVVIVATVLRGYESLVYFFFSLHMYAVHFIKFYSTSYIILKPCPLSHLPMFSLIDIKILPFTHHLVFSYSIRMDYFYMMFRIAKPNLPKNI